MRRRPSSGGRCLRRRRRRHRGGRDATAGRPPPLNRRWLAAAAPAHLQAEMRKARKSLSFFRNGCLSRCMVAWQNALLAKAERQAKLAKAASHLHNRCVSGAWNAWAAQVKPLRRIEANCGELRRIAAN